MAANNALECQSKISWGMWDTAEVWKTLFEEKNTCLFKDLVFPNLQSKYLDPLDKDFGILLFNVILKFASIELMPSEDTTAFTPSLRTICEITCMSSNEKEQYALPAQQSAKKFAEVLTRYMATWAQNINVIDVDAEVATITKSSANTHACIFSDQTMTSPIENASTDTFTLFMRVLCKLEKKEQEVPMIRSAFLTCIAIAKKGAASDQYLKMMESVFFQDTGIHLEISGKDVREIWLNIGRGINDTNVRDIISLWENYLPETALKTRTNLDIRGNGLTSLIALHKAVKAHPHFRWDVLATLFPEQESAVVEAFKAVSGNPYYGYKKDLGPVKKISYKDYAWVAKEILVKIDGDSALDRAACWIKRPSHQFILDDMIAKHKREHTTNSECCQRTETVNNLAALSHDIKSFEFN